MYQPSAGRFDRLDPFAGNLNDPLSFHKYGFVHGDPIQGADPSGLEFSIGGMLSAGGISATIGGLSSAAIAAAQGKSARDIAWAGFRGAALGFAFGGVGFAASAVGINAFLAGGVLGAAEGGLEAWLTNENVWEGAVVGGLFGGLLGWVGPAITKKVGASLKNLAERIAANMPTPNPGAVSSLVTQSISGWTKRPGGLKLAKVGDYWIKEVDYDSMAARLYGEGALKAQVDALKKLGTLAPEHAFENGRLIIRDVGKFEGPLTEFLEIKLLGSIRLRTMFNDIRPSNIGANGQVFDPALHPVHQGLMWLMTGLGVTLAGLGTYIATRD